MLYFGVWIPIIINVFNICLKVCFSLPLSSSLPPPTFSMASSLAQFLAHRSDLVTLLINITQGHLRKPYDVLPGLAPSSSPSLIPSAAYDHEYVPEPTMLSLVTPCLCICCFFFLGHLTSVFTWRVYASSPTQVSAPLVSPNSLSQAVSLCFPAPGSRF